MNHVRFVLWQVSIPTMSTQREEDTTRGRCVAVYYIPGGFRGRPYAKKVFFRTADHLGEYFGDLSRIKVVAESIEEAKDTDTEEGRQVYKSRVTAWLGLVDGFINKWTAAAVPLDIRWSVGTAEAVLEIPMRDRFHFGPDVGADDAL